MRFSRFMRERHRGTRVAIFHELHPTPVFMDAAEWEQGRNRPDFLPKALRDRLLAAGVLLVDGEREGERPPPLPLLRELKRPQILYLVLATDCNFSCDYCPIPTRARVRGAQRMSKSTAREAIDRWSAVVSERHRDGMEWSVILYGGEPTLNLPVMYEAVRHIRALVDEGRLPRTTSILLPTNGSLVNGETAAFLVRHEVSVVVGCDGPAEYHDRFRVEAGSGAPTFHVVERTMRLLQNEGANLFVSTAITPQNIPILHELPDFFRQYGVAGMGLNFLRGELLVQLVGAEGVDQYQRGAVEAAIRCAHATRHSGFEVNSARKFRLWANRAFFSITDCNGYGNQLVVFPDKSVGNCPFLDQRYGFLNDLDYPQILESDLTKSWVWRLPAFNPACRSCDAKSICGGGCVWNASGDGIDVGRIDEAMCAFTRRLFGDLLWESDDAC